MLLSYILPTVETCLSTKGTEVFDGGFQTKRLLPLGQPLPFPLPGLFIFEVVSSGRLAVAAAGASLCSCRVDRRGDHIVANFSGLQVGLVAWSNG